MIQRPFVLLVAAVALVTASCASTPHDKHDIGMGKVDLTLAFTDKELKELPIPPRIIVQLIPFDGSANDLAQYLVRPGERPAIPNPFACGTAPANAPVPASAPLSIAHPPTPGYYRFHNNGTIKLTLGGLTFQVPYPPYSVMQITNVKTAPKGNGLPAPAGTGSASVTTFDAITTVAKNFGTSDTYQLLGNTELDLVSHAEKSDQGSGSDTWKPAVKVYDSGGPGTKWNALGSNVPAKRAMGFQGSISKSKVIDVCGALIETLEVQSSTTIADLNNRNTNGTTTGQSDYTDFGTSLGGVIVSRAIHSTEVTTVDNAPVTVVTDVTSTLMSLTPPDAPPPGVSP